MTPSTAREIGSFLRPGDFAARPARRFAAYSDVPAGVPKFLQAARAGERILSPKSNIYQEEKAADEVFIVHDGLAFAYKHLPDGRRQILHFLRPGSFIGLHLLWFKAMPHSVQCLTDVSVCVFDKEKFGDLLRRMPEYEWQLLRYLASFQASSDERLLYLGRRTARERIARLVLDFHDHLANRDMVDGETFPFHLRQEHIADALGLTTAHVSRILLDLRHEGLLEVSRPTAKVLDLRGLRELAIHTESRSLECL